MAALDAVVSKYAARGATAEIVGLDDPSARWHALSGTFGADP